MISSDMRDDIHRQTTEEEQESDDYDPDNWMTENFSNFLEKHGLHAGG
jgi:hypothetical protein